MVLNLTEESNKEIVHQISNVDTVGEEQLWCWEEEKARITEVLERMREQDLET